jgi:hypothetical protein
MAKRFALVKKIKKWRFAVVKRINADYKNDFSLWHFLQVFTMANFYMAKRRKPSVHAGFSDFGFLS